MKGVLSTAVVALTTLTGCAYRLPPFTPPSQELLLISTQMPEQYTLEMNTGNFSSLNVPHDGRVKLDIPPYRRSCGVYLFNVMKVSGDSDPLKAWTLTITRKNKVVRKISLRAVRELATDDAGYHVLKIG